MLYTFRLPTCLMGTAVVIDHGRVTTMSVPFVGDWLISDKQFPLLSFADKCPWRSGENCGLDSLHFRAEDVANEIVMSSRLRLCTLQRWKNGVLFRCDQAGGGEIEITSSLSSRWLPQRQDARRPRGG